MSFYDLNPQELDRAEARSRFVDDVLPPSSKLRGLLRADQEDALGEALQAELRRLLDRAFDAAHPRRRPIITPTQRRLVAS